MRLPRHCVPRNDTYLELPCKLAMTRSFLSIHSMRLPRFARNDTYLELPCKLAMTSFIGKG